MRTIYRLFWCPGLLCSARLYGRRSRHSGRLGRLRSPTIAVTPRWARRRAHSKPGAAALCARRPFDGRLHRFRHDAARARAHRQTRAARHLGAARHARKQSRPRELIAMAAAGQVGRCVEALTPRFLHRSRQNDEGSSRPCATWRPKPAPRPSCAQTKAIMSRQNSRPLIVRYC